MAGDMATARRLLGEALDGWVERAPPKGRLRIIETGAAPDLLSLRAARALSQADVLIAGAGASPATLALARREARRVSVAEAGPDALAGFAAQGLQIVWVGALDSALAEALTCKATWLTDIHQDSQALAAAHEATGIYWHRLPRPELPPDAAQAALLEGQLLGKQQRHHDAAVMLARGWQLATSQHQHNALATATSALKAACRADPDNFTAVWHAETGTQPPEWLGLS